MNIVTKEIYGSSLVFYTGDKPSDTTPALPYTESYSLDEGAVTIYRNNGPKEDGSFPPTSKLFRGFTIDPIWEVNDISPSTVGAYQGFFKECVSQIFIATKPANDLSQNFFALSSTAAITQTVNQYGPATQKTITNDFNLSYPFLLKPNETLKFKLRDVTLDNNLPVGGIGPAARYNFWNDQWSPNPVLKVRTQWEEFDGERQYYERISLNDLTLTDADLIEGDPEVMLLDLRDTSPTVQEKPFTNMGAEDSFTLSEINLYGGYPYYGSSSRFMFSLILKTEGRSTSSDITIRKYARWTNLNEWVECLHQGGGGNVNDNVPKVTMKRGQYLVAKIFSHESDIEENPKLVQTNRQFPGFWLYGTVT